MSNPRKFGSRQSRVIIIGLASLLMMACCVQWVTGQGAATGYFVPPYDKSFMLKDEKTGEIKLNVKQATFVKNQVLIGAVPFTGETVDQFNRWYTGYQLVGFSQLDQLHKLPERRKEIVDDLRRARTKEIHDAVLLNTEKYMKVYVTSPRNFHPAVRFNAMLVIGDLNAEEQGVQARYPNPLPAALDFMLTEYQKPTQLEAVKLAAMIGILRHAQLNWARPDANKIPAAQQQKIAELMLALVNAKNPPGARSREGHVWMQRRAVEILAALGLFGSHDPTTQALTGLVRDHEADLTLRCTAAEAVGKLKPPTKLKIDPAKESLQLAALLVEACRKDLERIEAWQKKKMQAMDPSGAYGAEGSGMMDSGGLMPGGMGGGMGGMGSGMMPGGMGSGMMPGGMGSGMMPGGMGGGLGMPGMGSDSGMAGGPYGGREGAGGIGMETTTGPKDPVVELFRRHIKYEIECVRKGIGGVARLVPNTDARKPAFPELTKDIDAVWKATDPPAYAATLPGLHKSLKESLKSLETKTAALLPKPKTPAPEVEASDEPTSLPTPGPGSTLPGGAVPGGAVPGAAVPGGAAPAVPGATTPAAPSGAAPGAPPAGPAGGIPAASGGGTAAPPPGPPA